MRHRSEASIARTHHDDAFKLSRTRATETKVRHSSGRITSSRLESTEENSFVIESKANRALSAPIDRMPFLACSSITRCTVIKNQKLSETTAKIVAEKQTESISANFELTVDDGNYRYEENAAKTTMDGLNGRPRTSRNHKCLGRWN